MRLVTFTVGSAPPHPGALIEGDRRILDLSSAYGSVLDIFSAGDAALPPQAWYERPIFCHPSRFSVCGTETDVPWPAYTKMLDFELEFGCHIGRTGKDIAKERAREHINAMGPCLVTADEIGDPCRLEMKVPVNGEEWGRGNSRDMKWTFEDRIAHASRAETLHTGEFFGSGTVGNGSGLEQMRFLSPGDVVELEVERIGILRNRVVQ